MTGPAAPYAESDEINLDELGPMERTIQSTIHQAKESIAADQPITDRPRDASGKFVAVAEGETQTAKPGEWVKLDDAPLPGTEGQPAPGEGGEGSEAAPPAVVLPEGHVALPALAPEKVQGFRVLDAEGEIVPPDLKFEVNFRGPNGEVQPRTLDLPKLVNYARQGVYNHEREQQTTAVQQQNWQLTNQITQYDQTVRQLRQEREALLTNPDYLIEQLKRYEQENTPEARLARQQAEIVTQRQELEYQQAAQRNVTYLDTQVAPALNTIATTLTHVTVDELANRLAMLIEPFKVRTQFGVILNPNATQAVERLIIDQLVPWAQQIHASREDFAPATTKTPAKAPEPAESDLQAKNQKLRRIATAALKPVSGNQPQGPAASNKPPTSSRNMADFIVSKSLAGLGRG
jgi:5'-deoxynucleotidase YfbR-like HD superfamily hydrolase